MARRPRFNKKKLKELVLYVAEKSETDPSFGATKLNKILFFADFFSYQNSGRPITGSRYQKLQFGPAPRPLLPAVKELEAEGACAMVVRSRADQRQKRVVARRQPDLSCFTAQEIALVDAVIESFWTHTATMVSDWSHSFVGWELAEPGEDIPYESALVAPPRPLTAEEIEYGRELWRGRVSDGR